MQSENKCLFILLTSDSSVYRVLNPFHLICYSAVETMHLFVLAVQVKETGAVVLSGAYVDLHAAPDTVASTPPAEVQSSFRLMPCYLKGEK